MSKAANRAKTRWNAANYSQVKAYVPPETASAFKTACTAAGVSMNSALSQLIADYCGMQSGIKPARVTDFVSTNRKRRKKHEELLRQYIQLRDAQEWANENVCENFRDTEQFEAAEVRLDKMDEVIELLEDIY